MPKFAANLSMLWPELDVYDRFAAASNAGFSRVEILFVHALDHSRVQKQLQQHRLELVLFDPAPGNWDAGERGLLSLPGREAEFLQSIESALTVAKLLGTRRLNAIAGVLPAGVSRADAERTAVENLQRAALLAQAADVLLLIEPINSIDMPGYIADSVERGVALVEQANHPNVRLQLDQYHVGMMGGDAREKLRRYAPLVEHVQIADVPGRHEPGTGQQPIREFLSDLDAVGYRGAVGLEYRPLGSTEAALEWLPRNQRAA
jgi:hydroxypyruvate isomerase